MECACSPRRKAIMYAGVVSTQKMGSTTELQGSHGCTSALPVQHELQRCHHLEPPSQVLQNQTFIIPQRKAHTCYSKYRTHQNSQVCFCAQCQCTRNETNTYTQRQHNRNCHSATKRKISGCDRATKHNLTTRYHRLLLYGHPAALSSGRPDMCSMRLPRSGHSVLHTLSLASRSPDIARRPSAVDPSDHVAALGGLRERAAAPPAAGDSPSTPIADTVRLCTLLLLP
jgi:hypothetical protein